MKPRSNCTVPTSTTLGLLCLMLVKHRSDTTSPCPVSRPAAGQQQTLHVRQQSSSHHRLVLVKVHAFHAHSLLQTHHLWGLMCPRGHAEELSVFISPIRDHVTGQLSLNTGVNTDSVLKGWSFISNVMTQKFKLSCLFFWVFLGFFAIYSYIVL